MSDEALVEVDGAGGEGLGLAGAAEGGVDASAHDSERHEANGGHSQ